MGTTEKLRQLKKAGATYHPCLFTTDSYTRLLLHLSITGDAATTSKSLHRNSNCSNPVYQVPYQ